MTKRETFVVLCGSALAILCVVFAVSAFDSVQPAGTVGRAVWYEAPGASAQLLLGETIFRATRPSSGTYTVNRLVTIAADTGATKVFVIEGGGENPVRLVASRGPWIFTVGGDEEHARWKARQLGQTPLGLRDLAAQFGQIAAPWFRAGVDADGLVLVEADDKKGWQVDLAVGSASERPSLDPFPRLETGVEGDCRSASWPIPATVSSYAFVEREAKRISRHDHWALVSATVDEYGKITEFGEIAPGFSKPAFLCGRPGDVVRLGRDAVIVENDPTPSVSRLSESGQRLWTWHAPASAADEVVAGWAVGNDDVIVRVGRSFTRLGPGGAVRWRVGR